MYYNKNNVVVNKEEVKELRDKIIDLIKAEDSNGGLETNKLVMELKKERIFFSKPTSYGEEISINPEMREKILYYINSFLNKTDD